VKQCRGYMSVRRMMLSLPVHWWVTNNWFNIVIPGYALTVVAELHTDTQPFYGPFSGTTRVNRCQKKSYGLYSAREDSRGRHTDRPSGRHSIQTNQWHIAIIPPFLLQMLFLPQPSQFILAWDRHQVCWLFMNFWWKFCHHHSIPWTRFPYRA